MGPAGFTLAHHLLNDGHTVVGVDGLKIEPLPPSVVGRRRATGARVPFEPIRDIDALREPLDQRVMAGFGGVAEYGITVRWDKNFLKVLRLLIERRDRFALCGGVRFGGTLDVDDAFALGFDHIALAAGAGRPTVLDLPNGLANGVRTASDFLMALQLTGAARKDSVANMEIRLPVVVIGGGLTAIDTATESLAYYPVQVEKFLARYDALVAERGRERGRVGMDRRRTRGRARISGACTRDSRRARCGRRARAAPRACWSCCTSWGGVTIAYRRRLIDSPSYTLNHEEVEKALEEGIRFAEGLTPLAIEVDARGRASALQVSIQHNDGDGVWHEAGASVAAGAHHADRGRHAAEHGAGARGRGAFSPRRQIFPAVDEAGHVVKPAPGLAKPAVAHVLTAIEPDGRAISYFGDLHPSYFGNVVKAMGSAKQGYPIVTPDARRASRAASALDDARFLALLNGELRASVERVVRLTPTIVEVVVRAPAAARKFRAGTVLPAAEFRNAGAAQVDGTRLAMEGLALTGAWVDRERGSGIDDRARNGRLVGSLRAARAAASRSC